MARTFLSFATATAIPLPPGDIIAAPPRSETRRGRRFNVLPLSLRGDLVEHVVHALLALDHRRELVVRGVPHMPEVDLVPPAVRELRIPDERAAARNGLNVAPRRQRETE